MQIDKKKLIRQLRGCVKWMKNGAKGTFEYCTGFGKSFTAIILIRKLRKKNPNRSVIVIVPTIQLKHQWEEELAKFGVLNGTLVYVINSVTLGKQMKLSCDMLILDEAHKFASEEFSKVFELINYRFILGLTATVERLDGKHTLLVSKAPIVDTVTLAEARRNKWISEYLEFNLPVPMTPEEEKEYERLETSYNKFFKLFRFDFDLAMKCAAGKAKSPGGVDGPTVRRSYAMVNGFDPTKHGKDHTWHPDNIAGYAMKFGKFMRMRKEFLYNLQSKVNCAKLISEMFSNKKMITFSESTEFADRVSNAIPGSLSYHSYIKGETVEVRQQKEFKTLLGAKNLYKRNMGKLDNLKRKGRIVYWTKETKVSPAVVKRERLQSFKDSKFLIINTAKALDQGFDVKDIEIAVIFSRTTNPTQTTQRVGRAARKFTFADGTDKVACVINAYSTHSKFTTQDEKWLKKAQSKSTGYIWVNSLQDISLATGIGHNDLIDETEPE